ncbi:hypothetical protein EJ08DRAFT_738669 [Tothia fuscella]|uniref:Uncharacterized protein n=1 Tax=Tothia fuscella TaxID=1048955 RepID=A0A9P4NG63_9PEZI|nr:hypothetical protein EJ08DRAFT_738669 [Tothia fuscella]
MNNKVSADIDPLGVDMAQRVVTPTDEPNAVDNDNAAESDDLVDTKAMNTTLALELRGLYAKIEYLKSKDKLFSEVIEQLKRILEMCNSSHRESYEVGRNETHDKGDAAEADNHPRIFLGGEIMTAQHDYATGDSRQLLVKRGDILHVYARVNLKVAAGFNSNTGIGGCFPWEIGTIEEGERSKKPDIIIANKSENTDSRKWLGVRAGDYVRLYSRTGNNSYAMNLSSFEVGEFWLLGKDYKKHDRTNNGYVEARPYPNQRPFNQPNFHQQMNMGPQGFSGGFLYHRNPHDEEIYQAGWDNMDDFPMDIFEAGYDATMADY